MASEERSGIEDARTAAGQSLSALLLSTNENTLRALIENPSLDETHLLMLLDRKDLPGTLLDEIAKRKSWRRNYHIRRALAGHPHTPRLVAIRLLRELHLMDLVRLSLLPSSPPELRRLAEERVLAQLPQLPVGQRIVLARRASSRVACELIAMGPARVTKIALTNVYLTESQLLKTLAEEGLAAQTVGAIANHEKWSQLVNIRIALLRHPHSPVERILSFLPGLRLRDLEDLLKLSRLPGGLRDQLSRELACRGKQ